MLSRYDIWTYLFGIMIFMFVIILLILTRINGYTCMFHINRIFTHYASQNVEYYDTNEKWCEELRKNYTVILEEYHNYVKEHTLPRYTDIDSVQASIDKTDNPWNVIFLRLYNKDTEKIKYFPKTYQLLSNVPDCSVAMFSILHPGKIIPSHNGPYKGVLRYHLGLQIPKETEKCYINVNGIPYYWKEGKDVLFDDTFTHYVKNESDESRVILFLDIKKNFNNILLNIFNDFILYVAKYNVSVDNIVDNINKS